MLDGDGLGGRMIGSRYMTGQQTGKQQGEQGQALGFHRVILIFGPAILHQAQSPYTEKP
ncbi:MAG: hypothetical protein R3E89_16845 [Thiolinea sp.]